METIFIRDNEMISFGGGWWMETILMRDNETISFGGGWWMETILMQDNETISFGGGMEMGKNFKREISLFLTRLVCQKRTVLSTPLITILYIQESLVTLIGKLKY